MDKMNKQSLKENLFGRIKDNEKINKNSISKHAQEFNKAYEYFCEHGELPKDQTQEKEDTELDK